MKITKKELNQIIESKVNKMINENESDPDTIVKETKILLKFMNDMDKLSRKLKTNELSEYLNEAFDILDELIEEVHEIYDID